VVCDASKERKNDSKGFWYSDLCASKVPRLVQDWLASDSRLETQHDELATNSAYCVLSIVQMIEALIVCVRQGSQEPSVVGMIDWPFR
jgi:hypothetical protein